MKKHGKKAFHQALRNEINGLIMERTISISNKAARFIQKYNALHITLA